MTSDKHPKTPKPSDKDLVEDPGIGRSPGIATPEGRFIHAYEQAAVIESALVPGWRRRIAGVFRFPELS